MLYALSASGEKLPASPGLECYCQLCNQRLIPKCGEINMWHWAHKNLSPDCQGYEETEWHRSWKRRFPKENTEVRINQNGVLKIADIKTNEGTVIELQHSPITPEEIRFREEFYGKMKWIFDCREAYMKDRLRTYKKDGSLELIWAHSRKSLRYVRKVLFFDITHTLLGLNARDFDHGPLRARCAFYSFDDFVKDHS